MCFQSPPAAAGTLDLRSTPLALLQRCITCAAPNSSCDPGQGAHEARKRFLNFAHQDVNRTGGVLALELQTTRRSESAMQPA